MGETINRLPGFPAFFISPVYCSMSHFHWIGMLTRQSNVLFISQGRIPRDNTNLSVKSKNLEPEYFIVNILHRDIDIVLKINLKREQEMAVNNLFHEIAQSSRSLSISFAVVSFAFFCRFA